MPLQNRVSPRGEILAVSSRGLLMGNRGCLHNANKEIVRLSKTIHWVTCVLEYKGTKRQLMDAGNYTELFFLDEATALAAGHRPCYTCRHERYQTFKRLWGVGQGIHGDIQRMFIDTILHKERLAPNGSKVRYQARIEDLPDGTFIELGDTCFLVRQEKMLRWAFNGSIEAHDRPEGAHVSVLTPASIVACLKAGYRPALHHTADLYLA